jgi:hypothetical protein
MPQMWVTKQFAEAVILAGYDVQKYVTAMCDREFETKIQLKSSLPVDARDSLKMRPFDKAAALEKLHASRE